MVLSLPDSGVIKFKIVNKSLEIVRYILLLNYALLHPNHPSYVNTCNYKLQIPIASTGKSAAWPVGGKRV